MLLRMRLVPQEHGEQKHRRTRGGDVSDEHHITTISLHDDFY